VRGARGARVTRVVVAGMGRWPEGAGEGRVSGGVRGRGEWRRGGPGIRRMMREYWRARLFAFLSGLIIFG